ncbi:paternally-expressed gene 3 protein isoform X1 [Bombus flavifrons]|uniref:paternally-expressed gene 3 protein isoform X1 n=2 Tax=Bombus flavifrons TaxID=103934 RepID=UPI0037046323
MDVSRSNLIMEGEVTTTSDIPQMPEGIKGWLRSVFIAMSQTVVGQTLFRMVDSFLWSVEKSAQWSLPAQEIEAENSGKVFGKMKLIRPLPWLIFLPGLLILRIIRCTINVGAYIFGYPQVQPITMVKFSQRIRRRLRALNLKIAKSMRRSPTSKTVSLEKLEGTLDGEKYGVDSSEPKRRKPICTSKQFIDHEITSTSEQLPISQISSPQETDEVFMRSQKELATCELPPAQESCELPPAQKSCELPPAQESCELPPAQESCELPPAQESCELPSAQESCELPPAQESCELPPAQESCELPPAQESCELPPAQESCELRPAQESCELPPAQESCELPPAQESCELPPAQESCELPPAAKFRELPPAAKFRESPLALKFCELPPAAESRELPPAPESRELSPAPESRELPSTQKSCELLSTANSCELQRESCELAPTPESCESTAISKSCELPPVPEFCAFPAAPESCELPPPPESCELPPSQLPCELMPAPETCTSAEAHTLDAKEFPIVQEKEDYKLEKLEHHRDTN